MTIAKKISKYLQIGLLLTFFLPFFPSGCRESSYSQVDSTAVLEAPIAGMDTSIVDTSVEINAGVDKLNIDSLKDTSNSHSDSDKKETISDKIIKEIPVLKYLLKYNYKYSGIGYLVDTILYLIIGFGIVFSFILWIIGLIFKYKDYKRFHFINVIGIILFYVTDPIAIGFFNVKLWGYWVSFWWAVVMIILDLYIYFKMKRITRE